MAKELESKYRETSDVMVPPSKRYSPSDHKGEVLSAIKAAGEKGLSSDDLIEPDIKSGVARKTATNRVRRIINQLRKDGEFIVNLTPLIDTRSGKKPVYVVKDTNKDPAPKSQQKKAKEKRNPNPIQSEILNKTVAYLLSKHAQGSPEEINRNVRVNLGQFLPPKTTLPDIFGNGPLQVTDDSELKNLVIERLANRLEIYWNPESEITNISKADKQILESCIVLKQRGRKREDIIQDIDRKLTIR